MMAFGLNDIFAGFPLIKREREALDQFRGTATTKKKGVGSITINSLLTRRWIYHVQSPVNYGEPIYKVTDLGMRAIEMATRLSRRAGRDPSERILDTPSTVIFPSGWRAHAIRVRKAKCLRKPPSV